MSIREFKFKIGSNGTVEEVTTKVDDGDNQPSVAEKVLYFVVGIPVIIYFLFRWMFS